MTKLTDLRALAMAATPGPWFPPRRAKKPVERTPSIAYIAALDPATVITLCDCADALRELVAIKQLKDQAHTMNPFARGKPGKERAQLLIEHEQRKQAAWIAARAALAALEPPHD